MRQVDRGKYLCSSNPYIDAPVTIGYGATISAPHMVRIYMYFLEIIHFVFLSYWLDYVSKKYYKKKLL